MKSIKSFIFLSLIVLFVYPVFAQTAWITDSDMQFKIKVPNNYKQNQFIDGTDKILSLVSPDENVAVRVRAMKATQQFSADILQQVFEQNILNGAKQIAKEDGDLNGIPARAVAYTWKYNNIETVVGAYILFKMALLMFSGQLCHKAFCNSVQQRPMPLPIHLACFLQTQKRVDY